MNRSRAESAASLQAQLQADWPGLEVDWAESVSSTSTVLADRTRAGDIARGCLLVADRQTQGRGRLGRPWQSAPGASLTFSIALPLTAADWSGLSLAVGVALAESLAARSLTGSPAEDGPPASAPRLGLKWPNDLWLLDADGTGRKLCGMLIEAVVAGGQRTAVIGIGINLLPRDEAVPADGLQTGYASVSELRPRDAPLPKSEGTLALVAPAVLRAVKQFEREGFAPFIVRFAALDVLRGRAVRLIQTEGSAPETRTPNEGEACGVDARGALLVHTAAGLQAVNSGEVSVRFQDAAREGREEC